MARTFSSTAYLDQEREPSEGNVTSIVVNYYRWAHDQDEEEELPDYDSDWHPQRKPWEQD